jgi:hypothetical protein
VDLRVIEELEVPVVMEVVPEAVDLLVVDIVDDEILLIEPPGNREEMKTPSKRSPAVTTRIASLLWRLMPVLDSGFIVRLADSSPATWS